MKEMGGYIELENFHGSILHDNAIALNCGRNALEYICRARKIEKLYIPYFLCSSVPNLLDKIGVLYEYYHINDNFEPILELVLEENEWIYVVNYYGQVSDECILKIKKKWNRVIVDNAQAYFNMPLDGVDTIYTCRKYIGVPDGAFLYTDVLLDDELEIDMSYDRMGFLLGRYEKSASEFYDAYVKNNREFATEPLKKMSRLTENLLRGVDYTQVKNRRSRNYKILHKYLFELNGLNIKYVEGAFMYPFLHKNAVEIRKELQKKNIYIPMLWPNVLVDMKVDDLEYIYAQYILPLPCDQRYDEEDMLYLVEEVKKCFV